MCAFFVCDREGAVQKPANLPHSISCCMDDKQPVQLDGMESICEMTCEIKFTHTHKMNSQQEA